MKTESFDDAIKRKVESINYSYKDEDIVKAYRFVNQKKSFVSPSRYVLIVAASVTGIAIAGLLWWNFNQLNENKALHQTINTLQNHLAEVKTDKVFIKENNNNSSITKPNRQAESIHENKSYANNQEVNSEMNLSPKENNTNITSNPIENNSNTPRLVDNTNKIPPGIENNKNNEMSSRLIDKPVKDSTDFIDNSSPRTPLITSDVTPQYNFPPNETKHHSHLLSFKNLHYMAGIGGELANNQKGVSILGDVYFNHRLSVNIGVKLLYINNENYSNDNDFRHRKHRDFSQTYDIYFFDTAHKISNIGTNNYILQIPVSINYLLPLKDNYSLLFGLGTDLDVYVRQDIDFKHSKINYPDQYKDFKYEYPPILMNNIVLTAGVQKQWKFIVAQLNAFVSPQTKIVVYKKEDLYYGIHLNLLYSFGKLIKFV